MDTEPFSQATLLTMIAFAGEGEKGQTDLVVASTATSVQFVLVLRF